MKRNTVKKAVMTATLLLGLSIPGGEVAHSMSQSDSDISASGLTALATFGGGGFKITISREGNIISVESPGGTEHIANGSIIEGYVLCDGATNRVDFAEIFSGFNAPTVSSCSGQVCTVTRRTSDNRLELKQTITFVGTEREVKIKMDVKNVSGSTITGVTLRRHADFDVDGIFSNNFAASEQASVFAWNDESDSASIGQAMLLRHLLGVSPVAKVVGLSDPSCNPTDFASANPVVGDLGGTLQYNLGTITANQTKSITLQYQRN